MTPLQSRPGLRATPLSPRWTIQYTKDESPASRGVLRGSRRATAITPTGFRLISAAYLLSSSTAAAARATSRSRASFLSVPPPAQRILARRVTTTFRKSRFCIRYWTRIALRFRWRGCSPKYRNTMSVERARALQPRDRYVPMSTGHSQITFGSAVQSEQTAESPGIRRGRSTVTPR